LKILVTGSSGLLGSKIVKIALEKGNDVYSCYLNHKVGEGFPIKLDITDNSKVSSIFKKTKPDVIVHAAALTNVDLCERDRQLATKVNVKGTRNIVEAARELNSYLIYISTDYVFSGEKGLYREDDQPKPLNFYGYSKLEGEKIVKSSGLDYLVARTSVIYGARPASGKVNFALWVLERLENGEEVNALVDQHVSPTLNTNLAEMLLEACERRLVGTYHMAGATRVSRYEFALELAKTFNYDESTVKKAYMKDMKWVAKRPMDSSLNLDKARKVLKVKPLEISQAIKILKEELEGNVERHRN